MSGTLRFDLLMKKGDYLSLQDVAEVFGRSRVTIWKYESKGIDGFPRSVFLMGQKCWPKQSLLDYAQRKFGVAQKYTQLLPKNVRS